MRSIAAAAVLLGAGLVAGHALADTVPVPVPTVPVPMPTVPVPVPNVTVPAPPVAVPGAGEPEGSCPAPTCAGGRERQLGALGTYPRFFGPIGCRDSGLDARELLIGAFLSREFRLVESKPARTPADGEPPFVSVLDLDLRAEAPTGHDAYLRASPQRAGGPGRQAGLADVPDRRALLGAGTRRPQPRPLSRTSKAPAARGRYLPDLRAHPGREATAARDDRHRRGRHAELE